MALNLKKKRFLALIAFTASGLSLFHGNANAHECPNDKFDLFLKVFSTAPEVQQRLAKNTIKILELKSTSPSGKLEPHTIEVANADLTLPLMAPIYFDRAEGVTIEEKDNSHVNVIDKRAGNSNIKVFSFTRESCWMLAKIEDWSIRDNYLSVTETPTMNRIESLCYQRAKSFLNLGEGQLYPLTAEFFEAALENYLCSAASGDPQASLDAAGLSLSGMAPQLETSKVEALFKTAATTLAEGALGLSTFYCYGNNTGADGACQYPALAEKELIRAATMGSVNAVNYLGYSFETGELATKDVPRAMACYRLAAEQGDQVASSNWQRLKMQVSDAPTSRNCY
ncbi:sel1 repeat family protein [Pseudomonas cichorii]|nr:sel1 repeat family protein [Pseudomonas cichorii]MBX8564037.1 sel1 repeat family protein [Pseudomonas cichorii]